VSREGSLSLLIEFFDGKIFNRTAQTNVAASQGTRVLVDLPGLQEINIIMYIACQKIWPASHGTSARAISLCRVSCEGVDVMMDRGICGMDEIADFDEI
jgi:hypothetical protein